MNLDEINKTDKMYTILTKSGLAAVANATINQDKVDFYEFALGDGNDKYPNLSEDMTSLVNEVYRTKVRHVEMVKQNEQDTNQIRITSLIPPADGGFIVREVGLFDRNGNLLAVGRYPITWKPSISDNNAASEMLIRMIIQVANTSVINLKIDPTIINATLKDLEELRSEFNKQLEELDISGELENFIGDTTTLNTNSKEVVGAINENNSSIDKTSKQVETNTKGISENKTAIDKNKNDIVGINTSLKNYETVVNSDKKIKVVDDKVTIVKKDIGKLSDLKTDDKSSIVGAINENTDKLKQGNTWELERHTFSPNSPITIDLVGCGEMNIMCSVVPLTQGMTGEVIITRDSTNKLNIVNKTVKYITQKTPPITNIHQTNSVNNRTTIVEYSDDSNKDVKLEVDFNASTEKITFTRVNTSLSGSLTILRR